MMASFSKLASRWRIMSLGLIYSLGLLFSPTLVLVTHAAEAAKSPNIVLILVDDMGWADIGCNGSTFYRTPNIDRLAREGVRFTQAYAAAPVCSPTRASIMTGRHPARLHLTDWLPGRPDRTDQKMKRPIIKNGLPLEEVTLAEALKARGYATAHIGKWHLGGEGLLPQDQGFDVNVAGNHAGSPLSYFAPYRRQNEQIPGLAQAEAGEYLTDRLTSEAVNFIQSHKDQPFFVYLSHYTVHIPLAAKTNLTAKYLNSGKIGGTQTNAIYAAMIESLDDGVGRILDTLDQLRLTRDTVVLFTSDNGGLAVREGPNTPSTSNAPLRAGKGYLYEGGIRVPLIVRYPAIFPAGKVADAPVSSMDFFPTLVEIAGATPGDAPLDGRSLVPLLKQPTEHIHDTLFWRYPHYWHYPHYSNQGGSPGGAIREGNLKLIENYASGYLELYDLSEDLGETNNLAGKMPQKANELQKKLADWRKEVGAQMMTPNPDYVTVPITASADGTVVLPAYEVTIHGVNVRYEPPAHKNTIGYWTKLEDWVSWELKIDQPGAYEVEVLQGCGKGSGGSEVNVQIGDQNLAFTVQDTGGFQNFIPRVIGTVSLEKAGQYTLSVKPRTKPGVAVMDLRQVLLKRRDSRPQ